MPAQFTGAAGKFDGGVVLAVGGVVVALML
jgi:hypothetical protein